MLKYNARKAKKNKIMIILTRIHHYKNKNNKQKKNKI